MEDKQSLKRAGLFLIVAVLLLVLGGCCQLGFTCYELFVWAEPPLQNANIYLDDKLIKSSVSGDVFLMIPYKEHPIKIVQKGVKPFTETLKGGPGRIERALFVKFEPLDSVPEIPSQSDTAKAAK